MEKPREKPTALVTGANHGLGLALTTGLLRQGWQVCAGFYEADWSQLDGLQKQFPDALRLLSLDVSDGESVAAAVKAMWAHTDSLD